MRPWIYTVLLLLHNFAVSDEVPVYPPAEQQMLFRFSEPGYQIKLVASEPMIQDPVAFTFDGRGRIYVAEMRGYMNDIDSSDSRKPNGRVTVLEDTDGDGVMDRSTVFADNLILPRAVAVHPKGVLIAEHKALSLHIDTDGDLVADKKEIIDKRYARNNIEHSANGLLRAMDNRIYNAKEGHFYTRSESGWQRHETEKRGQWGICQDNCGRLFYNYNHSPLFTDLTAPGTMSRNPYFEPIAALRVSVSNDRRVFPIRPTRAVNRGYIPGVLDSAGRIKQYTSACAPLIYRGDLFPGLSGDAFVCETAGNLIQRIRLNKNGIHISGSPADPDKDFLTSSDERFRPCWLRTGPDGAIYIADMYRGVIQDAPHMSPFLREHSIERGLTGPINKGRLWKIVPVEISEPEKPNLPSMSPEELVKTLAHENGWWRDLAQMHLVERNIQSAIPDLVAMARNHKNPLARLHALWALEGLRYETPNKLFPCLNDPADPVRIAAIRVLHSLESELAPALESIIYQSNLSDELVLQLLVTINDLKIPDPKRFQWLNHLLLPRISNPAMREAVLSGLAGKESRFLETISPGNDPALAAFAESLAASATASGLVEEIDKLFTMMNRKFTTPILRGLQMGATTRKEPVSLPAKPAAAEKFPQLGEWFTWPGHSHVRKLDEKNALNRAELASFARGRRIYMISCTGCHGTDGKGIPMISPPLAGSDWVLGSEERLARVLFHGLSGPITVSGKRYDAPNIQAMMPPLAGLNNYDISSVLTYIRNEWGNTAAPVTTERINRLRIESQGKTLPWTEEELLPFK